MWDMEDQPEESKTSVVPEEKKSLNAKVVSLDRFKKTKK
jgi:hypothetical protein